MRNSHAKPSLIPHSQNLPDPRAKRPQWHELIDLLTIDSCTLLCGEDLQ